MLDTRGVERSTETTIRPEIVSTKELGLTDLVLRVLDGVGCYDECIREAERDGDFEVAGFLCELRRQDLLRARMAVRLLRRSPGTV